MKYFFVQSFFIQRIHAVSKIDLLSAYCNTYNNRSIYYKSPLQYAFSYFGSVLHKSSPPQSDISFSSVKLWRKCSEKQVYISTSKISEFSIFGLFIPPWNKKKILWSISNIRTVIRIYLLQCFSYFFSKIFGVLTSETTRAGGRRLHVISQSWSSIPWFGPHRTSCRRISKQLSPSFYNGSSDHEDRLAACT